jgi:hypothetical protein
MKHYWKPSKAQAHAFAERMNNDPEYANAYRQRKADREAKRRETSKFDYSTAGGNYKPTRAQHDFCVFNRSGITSLEQEEACNRVAFAYACNDTVSHDDIHIVNDLIRSFASWVALGA